MRSHWDALIALGAVAITIGPLVYYLNGRTTRYDKSVTALAAQIDKHEFLISCTPEGLLDALDKRNCVERSGYRIIRSGLDSIIVRFDKDEPVVVFHRSPFRDRFVPGNRAEIDEITRLFGDEPTLD
jgi:hypothetical protein